MGNHTWDHADLPTLTPEETDDQLLKTSQDIVLAGAPTPEFFRPPYGHSNSRIVDTAKRMGMTETPWNIVAWDWENPSRTVEQICDAALARARPGSIVLMHDRSANSVAAVPCIIDSLRARGYEPGRIIPSSDFNGTVHSYVTVGPW